MTERDWLDCTEPALMVRWLMQSRGSAAERKLRLFAVACCRRVGHLFTDPRSRQAVELAERLADGQLSKEQQFHAVSLAMSAYEEVNQDALRIQKFRSAAHAAYSVLGTETLGRWWSEVPSSARHAVAYSITDPSNHVAFPAALRTEEAVQASFLRCIFGPAPTRPKPLPAAGVTALVSDLAQAIYDERAFDRLPILADALEDAGCTNADVLTHCRQSGEHVLGCWVVDLVLGKS